MEDCSLRKSLQTDLDQLPDYGRGGKNFQTVLDHVLEPTYIGYWYIGWFADVWEIVECCLRLCGNIELP